MNPKISEFTPRKPEEVREEFNRQGQTIKKWASRHGFTPQSVIKVLDGRSKCLRGKGHKIAVLLGMKNGVIAED